MSGCREEHRWSVHLGIRGEITMILTEKTALEFVEDIEAGLSDYVLEDKYGLSGRRLLLAKAQAREYLRKLKEESEQQVKNVSAQELMIDLQSGVPDDAIMEKYGLTARQLQSLYRQIIEAGLATPLELAERLRVTSSQVYEAFVEVGKAIDELDTDKTGKE
jgi:hypothetical protein